MCRIVDMIIDTTSNSDPLFHNLGKTTLLLLNLRFDNRLEPSLQHPEVIFPGEAELCDDPVVGTHSPVPFLKNGNRHSGPPLHRHCTRPSCDIKEACQPHLVQCISHLTVQPIHPWGCRSIGYQNRSWKLFCPCLIKE